MKKFLTLLISMILLLSMLAGCGKELASSGAPESETEAPAAESNAAKPQAGTHLPIAEETVSLSLWFVAGDQFFQVAGSPSEILSGIELENRTNVKINYMTVSSTGAAQGLNLLISTEDYPDMISEIDIYYYAGINGAYEEDVIIKLNDVVDSYMPNYTRARGSNEEYYRGTISDDGDILQIHYLQEEGFPASYGPVARADWLEDLGMDLPVTYEDYYNYLTAAKTQYNASAPLILLSGGSTNGMVYFNLLAAGYDVAVFSSVQYDRSPFFQIDGVVKYGPLEDGFLDYVTMMNRWYNDGLIDGDFMAQTSDNVEHLISNDQAALWYGFSDRITQYNESAVDPNFLVVPIADAVQNKGDTNHLRWKTDLVSTSGVAISSTCKNAEVAAKWMDYAYSEEGYMLCAFGILGQSYEYDANGDPVFTDLIGSNPDGLTMEQAIFLYTGEAAFGPKISSWSNKLSCYSDIQLEAMELWTSSSDNSWDIPKVISFTTEEEDILSSSLQLDIRTYYEEWYMSFVTGARPLTEYDAFVEGLNSMGIEECIAIYQNALERYYDRG